jgi:hypothetical protein
MYAFLAPVLYGSVTYQTVRDYKLPTRFYGSRTALRWITRIEFCLFGVQREGCPRFLLGRCSVGLKQVSSRLRFPSSFLESLSTRCLLLETVEVTFYCEDESGPGTGKRDLAHVLSKVQTWRSMTQGLFDEARRYREFQPLNIVLGGKVIRSKGVDTEAPKMVRRKRTKRGNRT